MDNNVPLTPAMLELHKHLLATDPANISVGELRGLFARIEELTDVVSSIKTRMQEAIKAGCTTEEAYDSFYSELIDAALAKEKP
jgi:hypothetical protein